MVQIMTSKRRQNDGVTLNKAVIGVTAFMLVYFFNDLTGTVKSIAANVQAITIQQAVSYSHQQNTDARLTLVEKDQREFIKASRKYWSRKRGQ